MDTVKPRETLDQELAEIQDNILLMGSMLEETVQLSIKALKEQDVDLARQIMADDVKFNKLRYTVEDQSLRVIATQQPVAGDLRFIIAATHIAIEIERMADYAEGIAKLVTRLADEPLLKPLIDIPRMADVACEMLRASLDAFVAHDFEGAKAIVGRDDEIDQLYDQIFRELLTYMLQDPRNISRATFLLWVAHKLERIGDRATNISERTAFLATGKWKRQLKDWKSDSDDDLD